MVQIGWSFMIFAAIVAVLALAGRRERLRAALLALATAVLCAGLVATLVSNQRFGQIGRGTPATMLVRQMSHRRWCASTSPRTATPAGAA